MYVYSRKKYFVAIVAFLAILICGNAFAGESYIVKLKPNAKVTSLQATNKLASIFGKILPEKKSNLLSNQQNSLKLFYVIDDIDELSTSELDEIRRNAEFLEPNYHMHIEEDTGLNDPMLASQWGLQAINAFAAQKIATGNGVKIGLVDTGIDFQHAELADNLYINTGEDRNGNGKFDPWAYNVQIDGVFGDIDGIDNDGNGLVDDIIGYDFVDQKLTNAGDAVNHDYLPVDEQGHGTQVAGVMIAKANNAIGIAGLAYNAKLFIARAFDESGNAENDDIAKAIVYLAENGAQVINCSFGDNYYSRLVESAVNYATAKGVIVVTSAGNNGWAYPHYPSDLPNVISVGYIKQNGTRNSESCYGKNLSLMAPGTGVLTTKVGGEYSTASGSSLAAPFVTATVAMLLEQNPLLTPAQVRGILEATASPISSIERNKYEGAGLLNAQKVLEYPGVVELSIAEPADYKVFRSDRDENIVVIGTATAPLFDSYSVSLRNSVITNDMTYPVITSAKQAYNDTMAVFKNVGRLLRTDSKGNVVTGISGEMTLNLTMTLKNKKTIEKTQTIEIFNSDEHLTIDSLTITPIYYGDKSKYLVGLRTNNRSFAKVVVSLDDKIVESKEDRDLYSRHHAILLENLISGGEYKITVSAYRRDGETITAERDFVADINSFYVADFAEKNYSGLPSCYMYNQAADINDDDNPEVWVCEYEYGSFAASRMYSFVDNKFQVVETPRDSLYLPSGFGSMISGKKHLLGRINGCHAVYEYDGKYFNKQLYSDDQYRTSWGFYDFDGDDLDEVICTSHIGVDIVKYSGGKAVTLASTSATDTIYLGNMPNVIAGDFDNDHKPEIVFTDSNGNLYVFEYADGAFKREWTRQNKDFWGVSFTAKSDFDSDGITEILTISMTDFYQENQNNSSGGSEPKSQIWKVRVYKSTGADDYAEVPDLGFELYGVRVPAGGTSFKNGIFAGNIDGKPGDEVIVSAFPGLYCFKYSDGKLRPFRYAGDAFANNALIYDFDGNGINEIVYSGLDTTYAIEYIPESENHVPPSDVWGWANDEKSYLINWKKPAGATAVQVWRGSVYGDLPDKMLAETAEDTYTLTDYAENPGVVYFKAVYPDGISYASKSYMFVLKNASEPYIAKYSDRSVRLTFTGKIPYEAEADYFEVQTASGQSVFPYSVINVGENSYLLYLNEDLQPGDYTLSVKSFFDYYSNPTAASVLNFEVEEYEAPARELYLASLEVRTEEFPSIKLVFSEAVSDEALEAENYSLEPVGEIAEIRRADDDAVIICFVPNKGIGAGGHEYSITARNIKSADNSKSMSQTVGYRMAFVFVDNTPDNAFVYPNPIRVSHGQLPVFSGVPPLGKVEIYTLSGEKIVELSEIDGDGGVEWNMKRNNGNDVNSGVYLFKVMDKDGHESELKKFAITK